ncbi:hypothetical protein ACLI09_17865 [Flavobacterium sp. RHBU_24]|uniref:hypothetical protein n=1 Tax=Flavobacterium sp. RHBU_24 TaxID=3391185 RepID=UPI003984EAF0
MATTMASENNLRKGRLIKDNTEFVGIKKSTKALINNVRKNVQEYEYAEYKIFFEGEISLFNLSPSKIFTKRPKATLENNYLLVEINHTTIFSGNDLLEKQIKQQFEDYYEYISSMLSAVNEDVEIYNLALEENLKLYINRRIETVRQEIKTKENLTPFKNKD